MMGWRSVTRSQREVALGLRSASAGRDDVIRAPTHTDSLYVKVKSLRGGGDKVHLPFRPLPPRGTHHSGHHPQNALLRTPLLPTPTFAQAVRAPPHDPYRYRPPRPEGHWRRPPNPLSSWSRHPPMWGQPRQQQQDRRRAPPPRHQLPRYAPDWNDPTQY